MEQQTEKWYLIKNAKTVNFNKQDFEVFSAYVQKHFPDSSSFTDFMKSLIKSNSLPVSETGLQETVKETVDVIKLGVDLHSLQKEHEALRKDYNSILSEKFELKNMYSIVSNERNKLLDEKLLLEIEYPTINPFITELHEGFKVLFADADCPEIGFWNTIEIAIDYANSDPGQKALEIVNKYYKELPEEMVKELIDLQFPRPEISKKVYDKIKANVEEKK